MISLASVKTTPPDSIDKDHAESDTKQLIEDIGDLQLKLYAASNQSLLVILQGMDASGKDGAIKKVFAEVNPMGCHVICFKKPTDLEYSHDFLWRIHAKVPPHGMIHIFNRSHYEDILVPGVEKYIAESTIQKRYDHINDFENLLVENGTMVLKFFLHVSKDEQKQRLTERMNNPKKFWKHKDSDWKTREKWDEYMQVYDNLFNRCCDIPWNIIPADKNWYKEYLIAQKVHETLTEMNPQYPDLVTRM